MMVIRAALLTALTTFAWRSSSAAAEDGTSDVIGGHNAPAMKYPDIAAIMFTDQGKDAAECTGVLVAPTVVLTAGHCNDTTLTSVIIGSHDLSLPLVGEKIKVIQRFEFPSSQSSFDALALVLEHPAAATPRKIATGWAALEIVDGGKAIFVGYGATDKDATTYVPQLQEGVSTITDAACSRSSGCTGAAKPAGELGAGGVGIDTCPGDSGGPLYVETPFGIFVAGLTSRGYDNAQFQCSEGGIYVRPDKIVDWVETTTGNSVQRGPEPHAEPIALVAGQAGETTLVANDPRADRHRFDIVQPPSRATFALRDDGKVRVCATGAEAGTDRLVVNVVDRDNPTRSTQATITINIAAGVDSSNCSLEFAEDTGCGCQSNRDGCGFIVVGSLLILVLRRRRNPGKCVNLVGHE
jgi:secreted trypsin-like serine protease